MPTGVTGPLAVMMMWIMRPSIHSRPCAIEVADIAAAVPLRRLLAAVLRDPELVVAVFHVRGLDAHLAHDIRLRGQLAGRAAGVVERTDRDRDLGDRDGRRRRRCPRPRPRSRPSVMSETGSTSVMP